MLTFAQASAGGLGSMQDADVLTDALFIEHSCGVAHFCSSLEYVSSLCICQRLRDPQEFPWWRGQSCSLSWYALVKPFIQRLSPEPESEKASSPSTLWKCSGRRTTSCMRFFRCKFLCRASFMALYRATRVWNLGSGLMFCG